MIIGISGKMQSGKDTAANIIRSWDESWQVRRFADKLKDITCMLIGCSREDLEDIKFKDEPLDKSWGKMTPRLLMQLLGTECGREVIHENIWVNALFADYKDQSKWIIPDVRFPNEADAVISRGGLLLRLERDTGRKETHKSETALDDYPFEHVINGNGSIERLHVKVTKKVTEYLKP